MLLSIMKFTHLVVALLVLAVGLCSAAQLKYKPFGTSTRNDRKHRFQDDPYPFRNVSLDWTTRVNDLVSRLGLDEVIAQLSHGGAGANGPAPAIERLGIGPFQWNSECLRGYAEAGPATSFPDAINLASSFDKSIIYRVAEAGASEARAKNANYTQHNQYGDHTGLNCFSPVINIMAHPLWGRSHETYGEDPSLTAQLARAFVHGLVGNDSRYIRANANCKHFAAYNGPENVPSVRWSFNAVVPQVDLRMTFLPQFEACIKAGAQGVMCSYNSINGVPACANSWLLKDLLRREWNFTGFVISDEGAIVMSQTNHHFFNTTLQTAVGTILSGVNIELAFPFGPPVWASLSQAVQQGLLDKALLYERVWPLFYTRMRLGEFDPAEMNPYTKYNLSIIQSAPQKNLSLLAAKKSLVLLKHTRNVLPIKANSLATLTLIGPFSNTTDQFFGDYSPTPDINHTVTVEQGLKSLVQDASMLKVLSGCSNTLCSDYDSQRTAVVNAAKNERNLIILALGTGQLNEMEANDRKTFELPGEQPTMLEDVVSAAEANGVNVLVLIFSATSANISRAVRSDAVVGILQCGFPGQETGRALAQVLTLADDDSNPSGRLPYTWYEEASQLPSMTDYDMRNKTYRFISSDTKQLFGFGFGLSYSEFEYVGLEGPCSVQLNERGPFPVVLFNVTLSNRGPFNGEEVVQVYFTWPLFVSTDPRFQRVPRLQLVAFERVALKSGEQRTLQIEVDLTWLRLWSVSSEYLVPPGVYSFYVGGQQPQLSAGHFNNNVLMKLLDVEST